MLPHPGASQHKAPHPGAAQCDGRHPGARNGGAVMEEKGEGGGGWREGRGESPKIV
jgi:hypothetical protein